MLPLRLLLRTRETDCGGLSQGHGTLARHGARTREADCGGLSYSIAHWHSMVPVPGRLILPQGVAHWHSVVLQGFPQALDNNQFTGRPWLVTEQGLAREVEDLTWKPTGFQFASTV